MDRNMARRGITLIVMGATVVMALAFGLLGYFTPVHATALKAAPLCRNGSAPDYGFTYELQQPHWTVDEQNYAPQIMVVSILCQLNKNTIWSI